MNLLAVTSLAHPIDVTPKSGGTRWDSKTFLTLPPPSCRRSFRPKRDVVAIFDLAVQRQHMVKKRDSAIGNRVLFTPIPMNLRPQPC